MAEPFAAGVLNSLLQPRVPLARVARSTAAHSGLSSNFFTPLPRQCKQKSRSVDAPAVGHILECQTWAHPLAKQTLWGPDGPMRTTLMGELSSTHVRSRVRRTSKPNRHRLDTPERNHGQRQYHASHTSSAQPARDYSRSAFEDKIRSDELAARDYQPVASTSTSRPATSVTVLLFQQELSRDKTGEEHPQLLEQFDAWETSGELARLPFYDTLELAEVLAEQIDLLCIKQPGIELVLEWGQRLRNLVEIVEESAAETGFAIDSELIASLRSRSAFFLGDFSEHQMELDEHELANMNLAFLRLTYTSRVLALRAHKGISTALKYLFIESSSLRTQIGIDPLVQDNLLIFFTNDNMRSAIMATKDWDPMTRNSLFDFVLSALNKKNHYFEALVILRELRRVDAKCPPDIIAETCKGLASDGSPALAEEVLSMIDKEHYPNYTELKMSILWRDKPPDEESHSKPIYRRLTMSNFDELYPQDSEGIRTPKPHIRNYNAALAYYYHRSQFDVCYALWEDLLLNQVQPDEKFVDRLVMCYLKKDDVQSLMSTLEKLKNFNWVGDVPFYTRIIRFFGFHLDSPAATNVFEGAVEMGVKPDPLMYRTLMGAHFRAGAWKDAIQLFLKLKATRPEVLNIHSYNVVLQGCQLMGAPFRTVLKMFTVLEKQGLIPNKFTYAVLAQSALDANQYQFVKDLYHEIKTKNNWWNLIDVSFYTNVIRGYIRMGRTVQAKFMLRDMRHARVWPTAVTHGAIARAYTNSGEGGLEMAEQYITNIVKDKTKTAWRNVKYGKLRKEPLALLYGGIIDTRCRMDDTDGAERLIGEYLNQGGVPTIGILKSLLSMYGRANNLDDFRIVWDRIMTIAVKPFRAKRDEADVYHTRMRAITAPLNIYTTTMSQACFHEEVARTWSQLSAMNHDFDASNWHAFAEACIRAGQIQQAFAIMEHSLQPLFGNSLRNHFKEQPPVDADHEEKIRYYLRMFWVPPPRPLIESSSRVRAARVNKAVNRPKHLLTDEKAMEVDFTFPLMLLRRIGPNWHDWKPRMSLLESLLMVMLYLEDGLPIRPVEPGETWAHQVAADEGENRTETEAMLKFIHENHPHTMHRLRRFRTMETQLLGVYGFRDKYIASRQTS